MAYFGNIPPKPDGTEGYASITLTLKEPDDRIETIACFIKNDGQLQELQFLNESEKYVKTHQDQKTKFFLYLFCSESNLKLSTRLVKSEIVAHRSTKPKRDKKCIIENKLETQPFFLKPKCNHVFLPACHEDLKTVEFEFFLSTYSSAITMKNLSAGKYRGVQNSHVPDRVKYSDTFSLSSSNNTLNITNLPKYKVFRNLVDGPLLLFEEASWRLIGWYKKAPEGDRITVYNLGTQDTTDIWKTSISNQTDGSQHPPNPSGSADQHTSTDQSDLSVLTGPPTRTNQSDQSVLTGPPTRTDQPDQSGSDTGVSNNVQDGVSTVQPRVEPEHEVIINPFSQMGLEDRNSPSLQQEVPPPQANGIQSSAEPQQRNEEQEAVIDEHPQYGLQNRVINEEQRSEDGAESETGVYEQQVHAQEEAAPALSEDPSVADSPSSMQPVANQPKDRMAHHPPFRSTVGLPSDRVIGQQDLPLIDLLPNNGPLSVKLCLMLNRSNIRVIRNWKHLAHAIGVPSDVSLSFDCDTEHSPTVDLFEYLVTWKPKMNFFQLKAKLKDAGRKDLILKLDQDGYKNVWKIADKMKFVDLFKDKLDIPNRHMDWRALANKLNIPRKEYEKFGKPKLGPTKQLFIYINESPLPCPPLPNPLLLPQSRRATQEEPGLADSTVGKIKKCLEDMGRFDVLEVFERFKLQDNALAKDEFKSQSPLMDELSGLLDKDGPMKNWRNLAYNLGIPEHIYQDFDMTRVNNKNPTDLLLLWIFANKPDFTVEMMVKCLQSIDRNDVVFELRNGVKQDPSPPNQSSQKSKPYQPQSGSNVVLSSHGVNGQHDPSPPNQPTKFSLRDQPPSASNADNQLTDIVPLLNLMPSSISMDEATEKAKEIAVIFNQDKNSVEDPPDDIQVRCRKFSKELIARGQSNCVQALRNELTSGMTGPLLFEHDLLVKDMDLKTKDTLSKALTVHKMEWKIFAKEEVNLSADEIDFLDERKSNPVLEILNHHCGDWSVDELYTAIVDCGANAIADRYL